MHRTRRKEAAPSPGRKSSNAFKLVGLALGLVLVAAAPTAAQRAFLSGQFTLSQKTLFVVDTADNSFVAQVQPSDEVNGYVSIAFGELPNVIFAAPTTRSQIELIETTPPFFRFLYEISDFPKWLDVDPIEFKAYVSTFSGLDVVDLDTTETRTIIPASEGGLIEGVAVSPDGSRAYAAVSGNLQRPAGLAIIDTATDQVIGGVPLATGPTLLQGVTVSQDGTRVYVAGFQHNEPLYVVDPFAREVVAEIEFGDLGVPRLSTFAPNDESLYVSTSEGIARIDPATNEIIASAFVQNGLTATDVHPSGDRVYSLDIGGDLYSLDAITLETLEVITTPAANLSLSNEFIAPNP